MQSLSTSPKLASPSNPFSAAYREAAWTAEVHLDFSLVVFFFFSFVFFFFSCTSSLGHCPRAKMADAADDTGQLSPSQQDALQQYMQLTNQEAKDAIPLLSRSEWNVQVCCFFFIFSVSQILLRHLCLPLASMPRSPSQSSSTARRPILSPRQSPRRKSHDRLRAMRISKRAS